MTRCTVCGRNGAWQRHHPTARGLDGEYLDPELTMPLCHDHHTLAGDDLYTLGLATVDRPLTLIERVVVRLRRLAASLARVDAGRGGGTWWGRLAEACTRWADELAATTQRLDDRDPSWRNDPGFYPRSE